MVNLPSFLTILLKVRLNLVETTNFVLCELRDTFAHHLFVMQILE
jgi:hypothetical protein